jgi:hypothetical protein
MPRPGVCGQLMAPSGATPMRLYPESHTKLGGDKNMNGRRLDAGSTSVEDPRRTNDGHGQRALHSP